MRYSIFGTTLHLLFLVHIPTSAIPALADEVGERRFISSLSEPETLQLSTITQVKNPKWECQQLSTSEVYSAPFLKLHIPLPSDLSEVLDGSHPPSVNASLEPRVNGQTVPGSSGEFVFPVRVGTESQTLYVIFDTASGDFWLWSWQMPTSITNGRRFYNATKSSTATRFPGQSFNINYASGSVYGTVWQDVLWVDGNEGSIGVTGNPIECAQNVGGAFASLPAVDGIMGLNTWVNDSESPNPQQTWLSYVLSNLPVKLVQGGVGTMDFGFIDSSKYIGSITYTPVVELPNPPATGFWTFRWTGFGIGTNAFNHTAIYVLTDTGGNIVLLPQSIVVRYYSYVRGAYQQSDGSWCYPCSSPLPTFTIGVEGSRLVIASRYLIFAGLADGINCYGAIQATQETGFAYFGTPFFNALFVVHDYNNLRLGFAARPSS